MLARPHYIFAIIYWCKERVGMWGSSGWVCCGKWWCCWMSWKRNKTGIRFLIDSSSHPLIATTYLPTLWDLTFSPSSCTPSLGSTANVQGGPPICQCATKQNPGTSLGGRKEVRLTAGQQKQTCYLYFLCCQEGWMSRGSLLICVAVHFSPTLAKVISFLMFSSSFGLCNSAQMTHRVCLKPAKNSFVF